MLYVGGASCLSPWALWFSCLHICQGNKHSMQTQSMQKDYWSLDLSKQSTFWCSFGSLHTLMVAVFLLNEKLSILFASTVQCIKNGTVAPQTLWFSFCVFGRETSRNQSMDLTQARGTMKNFHCINNHCINNHIATTTIQREIFECCKFSLISNTYKLREN